MAPDLEPAGTDTSLRLEGIRKSFGAVTVVDDLSLAVKRGDVVSIVGPSGCGKTTLLRIIAGFIEAEGEIWLDGSRIDQVPSHRRSAAMVFQNYALFPHMTVFDNIAFGLRRQKTRSDEIARRVGDVLALVQLPDFARRYPRELSGGQQQRIALARAIVVNPKLLLLDEPLSNLDAKLRRELRQEFLRIHRTTGMTSLFVTHDLEEAFSLSDRVAVMNKGRIEQHGMPVEIFTQPKTRFVSDFVGHTNILEGRVEAAERGRVISVAGYAIKLKPELTAGRDVRVAVPAHLVRISPIAATYENSFPAKLNALSYLGGTIQFTALLGSLTLSGEIPAHGESLGLHVGQTVYVSWNAGDMILLPA